MTTQAEEEAHRAQLVEEMRACLTRLLPPEKKIRWYSTYTLLNTF